MTRTFGTALLFSTALALGALSLSASAQPYGPGQEGMMGGSDGWGMGWGMGGFGLLVPPCWSQVSLSLQSVAVIRDPNFEALHQAFLSTGLLCFASSRFENDKIAQTLLSMNCKL